MLNRLNWPEIVGGIIGSILTVFGLYLFDKIGLISSEIVIPSKAIIPFNSNECPSGWSDYSQSAGRFIIGVGQGSNLTERRLGDLGGTEKHMLTVDEIPQHYHNYEDYHYYDQEIGDPNYQTPQGDETGILKYREGQTTEIGGGKPHENIPPFVALKYCEKE
ncbi:phage tail protein [Crocosphaera subtropica]|nr:hypothetical protein [Crocosphaera subtropica]